MKRITNKITSIILVLSLLFALFTVFPMAEGEQDAGVKIIYNRGYEEGWDYDNGFNVEMLYDLDVQLLNKRVSASKYDYYMAIEPKGDAGGYLNLDLGESAPTEGKLFFEMDFLATAGNNIGGIVLISGMGEGTDRGLSHIAAMNNGKLYLLGEDAGSVPTTWVNISFTFDFDYSKNNPDTAAADEYLITVTYGEKSFERVMTAKAGFGISNIYIGAQENLFGYDRDGDKYYLDDVKLYYNVDEKTELPANLYGSAVDTLAKYTVKIEGVGGGGNYLSGQLPFNSEVLPYERVSDTDDEYPVQVYYHRHFGEGWNYSNGTKSNAERDNDFHITSDYASEINKGSGLNNYFLQMVQRNSSNGFIRIDGSSLVPNTGTLYIEFDIKASPGAHIPSTIAYLTPAGKIEFQMVAINNGDLVVLEKNFGPIGDEWCHVAIAVEFGPYVWSDTDEEGNRLYNPDIVFTAYVGAEGKTTTLVKPLPDDKSAIKGLLNLRIGRSGTLTAEHEGDWWGLDNLVVYSSAKGVTPDENGVVDHRRGFADIAADNFGIKGSTLILEDATKDFAIDAGAEASITEIMNSSLSMKVNSNNALLFGEKIRLFTDENGNYYGAPYKDKTTGVVMVPVDAVLRYVGAPYEYTSGGMALDIFTGGEYKALAVGRNTVEIAGVVHKLASAPVIKTFDTNKLFYIALDDVELLFPGYYVTWDNTGFFSIAEYDNFFDSGKDESYLQSVIWPFLFDIQEYTAEELYAMAKENTNNFDHPYIYVKQDTFDRLYAVYHSSVTDEIFDQTLIEYLDESIKVADAALKKYAVLDATGNYVALKEGQWKASSQGMESWDTSQTTGNHSIAIGPYKNSNGYDPAGGRLNVLSDGEECLAMAAEKAAFAYQITKDEKYARFAYDWIWALCQWEHWGPGHFLNCANSSRPMSVAFDWLYDGWTELAKEDDHFDIDYLAKRIFENGVYEGWRVVMGLPCEHLGRPNGGDSSSWTHHIGNWNPVCCLGMTVASLAVMGYDEYSVMASENALGSLQAMGARGFTYIGFDGAYRESAGYWAATSRMSLQIVETCRVAFGTDFNFSLNPGLNITDYYGVHAESNEYVRWNYHDDWVGYTNKYWFYLSAEVYDDPAFAALRYQQIENSEEMTPHRYDCLYYNKETIEAGQVDLGLDFAMPSIEGYMTRADWEPGALWAGILGGFNNVAHGQYDSGNWIYEEGGIRWFFDLGADDYNLQGGGLASGYYKYSTLGNNVLALGSMQDTIPHGQVLAAGGELVSSHSNEHGSAAVLDMSSVYGGLVNVTYARRGMLLTNDRKTLVIQDEVAMVLVQDLYWFAHFNTNDVVDYSLSSDGRTFLMHSKEDKTTGKRMTVRVNLITANRGFKFQVWDASTETEGQFVFDATPRKGFSLAAKGVDEGNRDHIKKLVISGVNTLKFDVAVVIEMIDEEAPVEIGYTLGWNGNPNALPPMEEWMPYADTRSGVDTSTIEDDSEVQYRPTAQLSTIIQADARISPYIQSGAYLGADREAFFRLLTDIEYAILKRNGRNNTSDVVVSAIAVYDEAKAKYDKFQNKIHTDSDNANSIATGLLGLSQPKAEETPAE